MVAAPLSAAIGATPRTRALLAGAIPSDLIALEFADLPVISRAFAPMVRALRYDVSEMAIATFLQARAFGKQLVLLPVVLAARFQEAALLCRADGPITGPADLVGRRIGARAYSQTTGLWLRGILLEAHGIRPEQSEWITFEDAHVAEATDPAWVRRAPAGAEMMAMLHAGALDAVVVGNEKVDHAALRSVFADPAAAGRHFWDRHHLVPVNHMLTVRAALAEREDLLEELVRMLRASAAGLPVAVPDAYPFGRVGLDPAVALAARYALQQGLLPRKLTLEEIWEGLPRGLGGTGAGTPR